MDDSLLNDLRCFVAAARLLRFNAAAKEIGLAPTTFSLRIGRLEKRLGVKLFERTTRIVRLTRLGKALVPRARAYLEASDVVVARLRHLLDGFRLTAGRSAARHGTRATAG